MGLLPQQFYDSYFSDSVSMPSPAILSCLAFSKILLVPFHPLPPAELKHCGGSFHLVKCLSLIAKGARKFNLGFCLASILPNIEGKHTKNNNNKCWVTNMTLHVIWSPFLDEALRGVVLAWLVFTSRECLSRPPKMPREFHLHGANNIHCYILKRLHYLKNKTSQNHKS